MPDRGPYRSLYTCIQDDPDFQLLSSDARLVFYTLKFSPLGNVAGIFVYHTGIGMTHSGLPRNRFEGALKRLEEGRWIAREGPLIWIRNGLKFEPGYSMTDPNKKRGVEKLLEGLPKFSILQRFAESYSCLAPPWPSQDPPRTLPGPSQGPPPYKESGPGPGPGPGPGVLDPDPETHSRRPDGDGFVSFWSLYPKKREKPTAHAAFQQAIKKTDLQSILLALRADVQSEDWRRDGGKYIPYPAKWLKRERWLDEQDERVPWEPPDKRALKGDKTGLAKFFPKDENR